MAVIPAILVQSELLLVIATPSALSHRSDILTFLKERSLACLKGQWGHPWMLHRWAQGADVSLVFNGNWEQVILGCGWPAVGLLPAIISEHIWCRMLISSLLVVTWNVELDLVLLEEGVLSGLVAASATACSAWKQQILLLPCLVLESYQRVIQRVCNYLCTCDQIF